MLILEELSSKILGSCFAIFNELDSGFLEPVYQEALAIALRQDQIPFEREKHLTIYFHDQPLAKKYVADFVCYDQIILELKAVQKILPEHKAQLMNYLKATGLPVGYVINFHGEKLTWNRVVAKPEWIRTTANTYRLH